MLRDHLVGSASLVRFRMVLQVKFSIPAEAQPVYMPVHDLADAACPSVIIDRQELPRPSQIREDNRKPSVRFLKKKLGFGSE